MNISHDPIFDTEKVVELYSKKDGVDVKYVCTSALGDEAQAMDIFYRETPHPQFGNRYFGLFYRYIDEFTKPSLMITNADKIEELDIAMLEDGDKYVYSQHRHDYRTVSDGFIDGGRAYVRVGSNNNIVVFRVKDGEFHEVRTET